MLETAKWYIVYTRSGHENKVAQDIKKIAKSHNLENLILEVKVPTETVQEIKNGKAKEVERKLYPSYVIIKMIFNNKSWHAVKAVKGVTCFVGPNSKPTPLTQKDVAALNIESFSIQTDYDVDDRVKVISGPLQGFDGKISEIDLENATASVLVTIFGRKQLTKVKLNQIAPINK